MIKTFRKQKVCYEALIKCKQRWMYVYIVCDRKKCTRITSTTKAAFSELFINSDILIHQYFSKCRYIDG